MEVALTRFNSLPENTVDMRDLAELIFAALPDFYGMIPLDHDSTLDLLADEIRTEGTECSNPFVATCDAKLAGIICWFPVAELQARQQGSLLHIMRGLDRIARKQFRDFAAPSLALVAPVDTASGRYIARVAVPKTLRGTGLGSEMLQQFASLDPGQPITLHVDRENISAIGYYQRLGFTFSGPDNFRKRSMTWSVAENDV